MNAGALLDTKLEKQSTGRRQDPLASLHEVVNLLEGNPNFRVPRFNVAGGAERKPSWLGRKIKDHRLRKFGAVFSGTLTLTRFQIHQPEPRTIAMDLQWHLTVPAAGWVVFIHFLAEDGSPRFQGDYPLDGEMPDQLDFVYSRQTVVVPRNIPDGSYRVRLGVWVPSKNEHLPLESLCGCDREAPGPYGESILLDVCKI